MEREEGEGASLQHPFKVFFLQDIFPIFSPTEQVHSLLICRTRVFLLCWDQWVGRGFSLSVRCLHPPVFSWCSYRSPNPSWSLELDRDPPEFSKCPSSGCTDTRQRKDLRVSVFIFKVTGGKVHHQGFIQSKDWFLLTFIHFLSTAFLSAFIKGLSLHSESFSSL